MSTIDALILDLIGAGRRATSTEVDQIIAHVVKAPFASHLSRVPVRVRNALAVLGIVCPTHLPNVEWHLLERVYLDGQWPVGTTPTQFEDDLHQSIRHPDVEVWTYHYFKRPCAGFLSPSHVQAVPQPEPYIFVVYSPVFGTLTTGYQTSDRQKAFIPYSTATIRHR